MSNADKLRQLMQIHGWTYTETAKILGVNVSTVAAYLTSQEWGIQMPDRMVRLAELEAAARADKPESRD